MFQASRGTPRGPIPTARVPARAQARGPASPAPPGRWSVRLYRSSLFVSYAPLRGAVPASRLRRGIRAFPTVDASITFTA